MLKNIVPRNLETITEYKIEFFRDENGGFSFDADKDGNPVFSCKEAEANYRYAMDHPEEFPYAFNKFNEYSRDYWEPAHGTCVCGTEVSLVNEYMGACQCSKCGRWYNLFGQMLNDPKYWEED